MLSNDSDTMEEGRRRSEILKIRFFLWTYNEVSKAGSGSDRWELSRSSEERIELSFVAEI
jgi:hypothetical protein